jgi:hypothetical protein
VLRRCVDLGSGEEQSGDVISVPGGDDEGQLGRRVVCGGWARNRSSVYGPDSF